MAKDVMIPTTDSRSRSNEYNIKDADLSLCGTRLSSNIRVLLDLLLPSSSLAAFSTTCPRAVIQP